METHEEMNARLLEDPMEIHNLNASLSNNDTQRRTVEAVLDSFRQYRAYCHAQITHPRREALLRLPQRHLSILANSSVNPGESLNFVDYCIGENSLIAESILQHGIEIFPAVRSDNLAEKATQHDMEQAVSIIKQLYRDWSAEGLEERHASYDPFIQSLSSSFPVDPYQHYKIHVLVPGCGLGRLPYELCGHGFSVVGVEKSYHAAIASDYIINKCTQHQHVLYPWAYNFNNNVRRADQLAGVQIPDVEPQWAIGSEDPDVVPHQQRLAMHIGDFAVDFKALEHRGTFDAVVTCFFIDTSPNVLDYILTIAHVLKSGGVWINHGPLQWHHAPSSPFTNGASRPQAGSTTPSIVQRMEDLRLEDGGNRAGVPGSFELSDEEVKALVCACGFDLVWEGRTGPVGYVQNPASMMGSTWYPSHWVARRV